MNSLIIIADAINAETNFKDVDNKTDFMDFGFNVIS